MQKCAWPCKPLPPDQTWITRLLIVKSEVRLILLDLFSLSCQHKNVVFLMIFQCLWMTCCLTNHRRAGTVADHPAPVWGWLHRIRQVKSTICFLSDLTGIHTPIKCRFYDNLTAIIAWTFRQKDCIFPYVYNNLINRDLLHYITGRIEQIVTFI